MKFFRVRVLVWVFYALLMQTVFWFFNLCYFLIGASTKIGGFFDAMDIISVVVVITMIFFKVIISKDIVGINIMKTFEWNKIERVSDIKLGPIYFLRFHSKYDEKDTCIIPLFVYNKAELIHWVKSYVKEYSIKNDALRALA